MPSSRDIMYTTAHAEIQVGEIANKRETLEKQEYVLVVLVFLQSVIGWISIHIKTGEILQ
jgi:hypothetical protein